MEYLLPVDLLESWRREIRMKLDGRTIVGDARTETPRRSRALGSGDRILGPSPREPKSQFAAAEEALRLVRAFQRIPDPAIRAAIIGWVAEQADFG